MDEKVNKPEESFAFSIPIKHKESVARNSYSVSLKERNIVFAAINQKIGELERNAKVLIDAKLILPPLNEDKSTSNLPEEWQTIIIRIDRLNSYIQHFHKLNGQTKETDVEQLKIKVLSAYKEANLINDEYNEYKDRIEIEFYDKNKEINKLEVSMLLLSEQNKSLLCEVERVSESNHQLFKRNQVLETENNFQKLQLQNINAVAAEKIDAINSEHSKKLSFVENEAFNKLSEHAEINKKLSLEIHTLKANNCQIDLELILIRQNNNILKSENAKLKLDGEMQSKIQNTIIANLQDENEILLKNNQSLKSDVQTKSQTIAQLQMQLEQEHRNSIIYKTQSQSEFEKLSAIYQAFKRQSESEKSQFANMANETRQLRRQYADLTANTNEVFKDNNKREVDLSNIIIGLKLTIQNMTERKSAEVQQNAIKHELQNKTSSRLSQLLMKSRISCHKLNNKFIEAVLMFICFKMQHWQTENVMLELKKVSKLQERDRKVTQNLVVLIKTDLKSTKDDVVYLKTSLANANIQQSKLQPDLANTTSKFIAQLKHANNKYKLAKLFIINQFKQLHLFSASLDTLQTKFNHSQLDNASKQQSIIGLESNTSLLKSDISDMQSKLKQTLLHLDHANNALFIKSQAYLNLKNSQIAFESHFNANMNEYQQQQASRIALVQDTINMSNEIIKIVKSNEMNK